jgi:hypothetical protein
LATVYGKVADVGGAVSSATGTSLPFTSLVNVPGGDDVFVLMESNATFGTPSCTDSKNNTYVQVGTTVGTSPFLAVFRARVTNPIDTNTTITPAQSSSSGGRVSSAIQATGLAPPGASGSTDQTHPDNFIAGTTQTETAPAANAAPGMPGPGEFELCAWGMGGATTGNAASGWNAGTKFESTGTVRGGLFFDRTVFAGETASCVQTWTTSVVSSAIIATFPLAGLVIPTRPRAIRMQLAGRRGTPIRPFRFGFVPATGGPVTNLLTLTCSTNISSTLQNQAQKPLSAAVNETAVVTRIAGKTLAAALSDSATLSRSTAKTLTPSQTLSAVLAKLTGKTLTGALNDSAVLTLTRVRLILFTCATTVSAALTRQVARIIPAALSDSAATTRSTSKTLAAAVTDSATLKRTTQKTLAAAATDTAIVTRQAQKPLAASTTDSATLSRRASKTLTAAATSSAVAQRSTSKTLAASSTVSATLVKRPGRVLAGAVAVSGALVKRVGKTVAPVNVVSAAVALVKHAVAHALGRSFGVSGYQQTLGDAPREAGMGTAPRQATFGVGAHEAGFSAGASQKSFDEPEPLP